MNQPSLYQRANIVQRHDAKRILKEFSNVLHWRLDGEDTLLDIGCGSGDVLMDLVLPLLPQNFGKIVGTDISEKMIRYARQSYEMVKRTHFEVLDIGAKTMPSEFHDQFDHVTSFYCLHWVKNQRQAVLNINKMLRRKGGDCLLVFLATSPIYDVYRRLSAQPKWSHFMSDVDDFISPLHNSEDPSLEFCHILRDAGFIDYKVEIRDEVFIYEGVDSLINNIKAVSPFLARIPESLHKEFLDDLVNIVVGMQLREEIVNSKDYKFVSPYKLVVAYARK